ncbi:hypothetical protein DFQ14_103324 [Halopolyspora algeriensis]|uniref:Integral membrane protein n=1 Tax=Halopolyspora algeriensis TaxID=1500506 RepID=A0A368VVW9_9ACTN|nr:hypothetical protein [Halopolyspora algeriensis]RCW45353.1 hypothetical protein DFQ14_103324 [Halopolyspora algeriensis]TQM47393.1 hypothetical protein FHU43_3378 [Halopolyspora algeriensis]
MSAEAAPRTVRAAGVVTALQGLVGFAFVAALLFRASTAELGGAGTLNRSSTYGEAGYYAVLSTFVLAAGIGLWRGKRWARTPSLLLQLLLLGVSWYAFGPSDNPLFGLVVAAPAMAVLWCLFNRQGRAWAFRAGEAPDADTSPK